MAKPKSQSKHNKGTKQTSKKSQPTSDIRIIKAATCPTLSSSSTLEFHIGINTKQELLIQISGNSGSGYFNKDWVPYKEIQQCFKDWPKDAPITAMVLDRLFKGQSANSRAFLLAILKQEKLVETTEGLKRTHQYIGDKAFLAEMKKLTAVLAK